MNYAPIELPRHRLGFTLVELLVVVAIMGLLIIVGMPVFENLGKGTGMQTAVTELKVTLSLSRQWAITHRQKVYVVFPDEFACQEGSNPTNLYKAYRAYGVFAVTNTTTTPMQGFYVKEWTFLPPGLIFDDADRVGNVYKPNPNGNIVDGIPFPTEDSPAPSGGLPAAVFRSDGTTDNGGAGYHIYVREGGVEVNEVAGTATPMIQNPDVDVDVNISGMTGGVIVNRQY